MKRWVFLFFLSLVLAPGIAQEESDTLLRQAVESMFQKDYSRSLELLARAKTLAVENNWHKQHFLALNNMGANYYSMLDYGEALNYYLEAYTLAIKELDAQQEMTVLNNIAILFLREKNYSRAIEYFEKAYELAKNVSDQKKIALYAVNLGLAYNSNEMPQRALYFLEESLSLREENPAVVTEAQIGLADNLLLRKEYAEAIILALELLSQEELKQDTELRLSVLLILSNVYEAQDDLLSAESFALKAMEKPVNLESKILVYEQLVALYTQTDQYEQALTAKDSLLSLHTDLNNIKNGKLYETNKVKFEIQNYQQQLKENKQKLEKQRKSYFKLLGGALLAILLTGWALRNSYIKNKQEKVLHRRNQELQALELKQKQSDNLLLEQQMQEKETLGLLEQERLKNEIEVRNRKLSAKALYLSERNELIAALINDLSNNPEINDNKSIKEQIKKLKTLLKTDAEWDEFIRHFEEVNHNFLMTLKRRHPRLNANDIRFVTYLYMNLSHKEIAALLNITAEACRKRKERISKKMELEDSSLLFNYLSSLK